MIGALHLRKPSLKFLLKFLYGQTMKMDVLRCETVQGVLKELTVFALVYNLVRAVMYEGSQRLSASALQTRLAD